MKEERDTGSHLRVQGRGRVRTCAEPGKEGPRKGSVPFPAASELNEGRVTSNPVRSQRRAPSLLLSLHLAPRAGVCRAQGLSAYITLVPFGGMKNLPGGYCKQAYVHPNRERKGQGLLPCLSPSAWRSPPPTDCRHGSPPQHLGSGREPRPMAPPGHPGHGAW